MTEIPASMTEHSDMLWFLLILFAAGLILLLQWVGKRELKRVGESVQNVSSSLGTSIQTVADSQARLGEKFQIAIERVHGRVDAVERDVNQLKGEHRVLHQIREGS